jgi:FkbM family methyltransferase
MFQLIKEIGWKKFLIAGAKEIHRKVWREFIKRSYAQDYEDLIIDGLMGKNKGRYLEIGAYHPTRLSNTYRFYKKGWRGVTVEPNPNIKKLFERIRPKDKFINVGIGEKAGKMAYYEYLIPALNTFSEKQVKENLKGGYKVNKMIKVEILNIADLLKRDIDKKINLLSLDVEGWDMSILKNWDWRWRPKVICVETDKKGDIEKALIKQDYKLKYSTQYNSIFLSEN